MKKSMLVFLIAAGFVVTSAFAPAASKLNSTKTHVKFFSTTPVEDIEAHNYTATSSIIPATGDIIFVVPMQGFEFVKALMQKHFNQDKFLDTKQYPRATFKGKITNVNEVNFDQDGVYDTWVEGEMTLKGVTKPVKEKGTITVKGNEITAKSSFKLTLADYGITFVKGKPSSNIAKTVAVSLTAAYQPE